VPDKFNQSGAFLGTRTESIQYLTGDEARAFTIQFMERGLMIPNPS